MDVVFFSICEKCENTRKRSGNGYKPDGEQSIITEISEIRMPYIAKHNGKKKAPRQVPIETDVECPTCGERMRVWRKSTDGRARHFKHIGDMGHGEGGGGGGNCDSVAESDKHMKWKSFAADRLEQVFEDRVESCQMEREMDAPSSDKAKRIGDVVMSFTSRDEQLGEGIVVEVQHKNDSKDMEATTDDFVEQDHAVAWLDADDFAEDRCRLAEPDFRKRARELDWCKYFPDQEHRWEPQYNFKSQQQKWRSAFQSGLAKSGAPATLPPEWCDEKAREIWENQYWHSLFTSTNAFGDYDSESYFKEVRKSVSEEPQMEIKLPPEWCAKKAREIWERQDWDSLFTATDNSENYDSESYITEVCDSLPDNPEVEIKLPPDYFHDHEDSLRTAWSSGALQNDVGVEMDVVRPMSENNADRSCAECSEPADYYLLKNGVLSEFRCSTCSIDVVKETSGLDNAEKKAKVGSD